MTLSRFPQRSLVPEQKPQLKLSTEDIQNQAVQRVGVVENEVGVSDVEGDVLREVSALLQVQE